MHFKSKWIVILMTRNEAITLLTTRVGEMDHKKTHVSAPATRNNKLHILWDKIAS